MLYFQFFRVSELFVDDPSEIERLPVRVNISLPKMKCDCEFYELVLA